jgi:NAD(P)-dependent dehydrogenase (short-subunit alcohol dehydrogenase family)
MAVSLEGAVTLVTGAAGGVGSALAMEAARRGAKVMVVDMVSGEDVVARLRKAGAEADWTTADVTDYASVKAAIAKTVERFGGLNVLCNNVGGGVGGGLDAADPDAARKTLDVNVLGYFNPIHAGAELLRQAAAAGQPAYILNTGSEHSLGVPPHVAPMSVYTTSKFAVLGLTETARRDFGPSGIGVSLLAPGWVLTPMVRGFIEANPDFAKAVGPYGQEPELVARMAFDGLLAGQEIIVTGEASRKFALERARRLVEQFGG